MRRLVFNYGLWFRQLADHYLLIARRILSKILFCQEPDLSNVVLHLPLGGAIAFIACYVSGDLALACALTFTFYEIVERKVISDRGFPDLQGSLAGMIIGGIIIAIIKAI